MKPVEENKMQVFSNEEFGEIRTTQIDGEPWFVVADVCAYFGVANRNRIMQTVDAEDKGGTQMDTPGGVQTVAIVNESGLYSVLFALQPAKARGVPENYIEERQKKLHDFKRWITHEVIPAIRKHGAYIEPVTLDKIISCPDFGIRLLTELKNEQEKRKTLEEENAVMQPKAEYFDDLVDRNTLTSFRDTAKEFRMKQKEFIAYLMRDHFVYRDQKGNLMPYAEKNDGLFSVRECRSEKNKWSGVQTLITPKGRETFRLLYARQ